MANTPESLPPPPDNNDVHKQRVENVVNPKVIGRIIHEAYGMGFDGSKTEPATLEKLRTHFGDKEIKLALKAGFLMESMTNLTETVEAETFKPVTIDVEYYSGTKTFSFEKPSDLCDEFGDANQSKIKYYLKGMISQHVNGYFRNEFQNNRPNAFAILCELEGVKAEELQDTNVIEALDLGLDHVLAMQKFISDRVPEDQVGPAFERSLPVLYKLARQEVFQALDLKENIFTNTENNEKDTILRDRLAEQLGALPQESLNTIRVNLMQDWLDMLEIRKLDSDAYTQTLARIETAVENNDVLIDLLSGRAIPGDISDQEEVRQYFETESKYSYIHLKKFLGEDATVPPHIHDTIVALDLNIDTTMPEEFFEMTPDGIEGSRVQLVAAPIDETQPREKSKLLRQPDPETGEPMDLVVPPTKTIGCPALHAKIPYTTNLDTIGHVVQFHPQKLNGISFTAMMTMLAEKQARLSKKNAA